MAQQTYAGSCHCGKVRFTADLDLAAGTNRCNCSICAKLRAWTVSVPPQQFRLLSGENETSAYVWGSGIITRHFCRHCGVHVYGTGHLAEIGGDFCGVNIACLDLDPQTLAALPLRYFDGLNNNWQNVPEETRYL
jgi:hypothetical protein